MNSTGPERCAAFRVVSPPELRAEHWFELECVEGGTLLRHTIDGETSGAYEVIWRDRIEPAHDLVLEAMLDNIDRIVLAPGPPAGLSAGDLPRHPSRNSGSRRPGMCAGIARPWPRAWPALPRHTSLCRIPTGTPR